MRHKGHGLHLVREYVTKRTIKRFAQKFDLVYFGFVDQRDDEHELVRGITVSAEHIDKHYTVGNFKGHDITLVQRRDTLEFPKKPHAHYSWLILQVDLKKQGLPHIFIDANHHDETFYANLFIKFGTLQKANSLFTQHDELFNKSFKVYAQADKFNQVDNTLNHVITNMLAHHFKTFDFEIFDDRLLIYSSNTIVTMNVLQDMLRIGMWMADHLNKVDLD